MDKKGVVITGAGKRVLMNSEGIFVNGIKYTDNKTGVYKSQGFSKEETQTKLL